MSTTYTLHKEEGVEITATESSSFLTIEMDNGVIEISTERMTADQIADVVVQLARAGSYCSEDPDAYLRSIAKRLPY